MDKQLRREPCALAIHVTELNVPEQTVDAQTEANKYLTERRTTR